MFIVFQKQLNNRIGDVGYQMRHSSFFAKNDMGIPLDKIKYFLSTGIPYIYLCTESMCVQTVRVAKGLE